MRFFGYLRKSRVQGASNEELRFHLEKEVELNLARGLPLEEARRQAMIAFGGVQQTREAVAEQRGLRLVETTLQDFRYALRILRKSPGFAAIAIGILAVGIGANAAIFSAVNGILFARWPVPSQDQLVLIKEVGANSFGLLVSVPNFQDYRIQQTTFQQLSLWVGQTVNLTGQARPDRLIGAFVSDNFFDLLGVRAAMGRTFLPGEDRPGAAPVAVISYEAWQTRFAADPQMIGRKVTLNNEAYEVAGILPKGFSIPVSPSEVFITAQHLDGYKLDRQIRPFLVFGRMKTGTTRADCVKDLNVIAQRLAHDYPRENAGLSVELVGMQELTTQRVRSPLLMLFGAVALVLLIVCANVAGLLISRGSGRGREIAVRAALGAARARLIRQLLCESLLLAALGAGGGILLAQVILEILPKIAPVDVAISGTAMVDFRVLAFVALVSLLTGLLFGVTPALQFSRLNLTAALANGNRTGGGRARSRLHLGFVVAQVALSLILVVSATLLVKSFHALITADPGFMPDHLLSMEYRLPPTKYRTDAAQWEFHRQMLDRVQQVPGVISAAIVQTLPFSGNWSQEHFTVRGQTTLNEKDGITAFYNVVTPEYFSTIGIPLIAGRNFSAHDDSGSFPVAIVNRSFALKYFGGRQAVGEQLAGTDSAPLAVAAEHTTMARVTIIGVVGNAKQRFVREDFEPQVYFTYPQWTGIFGTLLVRTAADPMGLSEAVRQAVWSVDKDQPVWKIRTLDSLIEKDTAPDRFAMLLMSALSGLALFLSALGAYGMLSNMVTQRTRELGVRMALGAPIGSVLKLVLNHGFKLLLMGCGFGVVGAILCSRLLGRLLYGVAPQDLSSFALGLTAMVVIGLVASYLPARRATRVDPMIVLREE